MFNFKIEKSINEVPLPLSVNTLTLVKQQDDVKAFLSNETADQTFPIDSIGKISIKGPTTLIANLSDVPGPSTVYGTYIITDYDFSRVYNITPLSGSITRSIDTIQYMAPTTQGSFGFMINGKVFNVQIVDSILDTPVITSPINNSVNLLSSVTLTSSAFNSTGNPNTFLTSDWQLATDSFFNSIVTQVTDSSTTELSWVVNNLTESTQYFARTRQKGSNGIYSSWSLPVAFTTRASFLATELSITLQQAVTAAEQFGHKVKFSKDGSRLFISAKGSNVNNTNVGVVYSYLVNGNSLTFEAELLPWIVVNEANFGAGIDTNLACDKIFIGSPGCSFNGLTSVGSVFTFTLIAGVWTPDSMFIASDGSDNDEFGSCLSCNDDGTVLAVGATGCDINAIINAGAVYIYSDGVEHKVVLTDEINNNNDMRFGYSVDINSVGNKIVIGNYNGIVERSVLLSNNQGTWEIETSLPTSPEVGNGFSVSINETSDRLAIGSCFEDANGLVNCGVVYTFTKDVNDVWTQDSPAITPADAVANQTFGNAITFCKNSNKLIIGAKGDSYGGFTAAGSVYIFEPAVGGLWTQVDKLTPTVPSSNSNFGSSLDINNLDNTVVIGADNNSDNATQGGCVYLYSL